MRPSMADAGRGGCGVGSVARRWVGRSGCMSTRRGPRRDVSGRSKMVEAPSAKPGSASSGAPAHPPMATRLTSAAGNAALSAAALPRCTGTLRHAIGGSVSPVARRGPGDQGVGRASVPPAAGHPPGRPRARKGLLARKSNIRCVDAPARVRRPAVSAPRRVAPGRPVCARRHRITPSGSSGRGPTAQEKTPGAGIAPLECSRGPCRSAGPPDAAWLSSSRPSASSATSSRILGATPSWSCPREQHTSNPVLAMSYDQNMWIGHPFEARRTFLVDQTRLPGGQPRGGRNADVEGSD